MTSACLARGAPLVASARRRVAARGRERRVASASASASASSSPPPPPPPPPRPSDDDDGVDVVRYGLASGSVAYFPRKTRDRAASPSSPSSPSSPRPDTDPTTRYEDGALDELAIALFNRKLESALRDDAIESTSASSDDHASVISVKETTLPKRGFDRLVALADLISVGRSPSRQRAVVLTTLLGLIPPWVRARFKEIIRPEWRWVDEMNAVITVNAFAWLVGPCEIIPRESDGVMSAVKLRKCRYLEQCGCTASCVNFCKMPTQAFFREAFGVDAHLAPDHSDGSCVMTFGAKPPSPDPAFEAPCYASCATAKMGGCACHRLGEQE